MAQVIEGAEKYQLAHPRSRQRALEGQFESTEEAIAMAVMYTANHMKVRAIVALTESGATPLWMSRIRSDIPIYAFTRHEATRRRVTLYRGVYPVTFDVTGHTIAGSLYGALFARLLELRAGAGERPGDPHQGRAVGRAGRHELHADPAGGARVAPRRLPEVTAGACASSATSAQRSRRCCWPRSRSSMARCAPRSRDSTAPCRLRT